MSDKLLLVTPPVVRLIDGNYEIESDCVNNLTAYLRAFDYVTIACPIAPGTSHSGILRSLPIDQVDRHQRLSYLPLPYPYREDRYWRNRFKVGKLLQLEIDKADYLLFSAHSKYDWPTLAARLAMKSNRRYGMESDYDFESVAGLALKTMPGGINKFRKKLWMRSFSKSLTECFARSSIALLQGQEVFDAYATIAPKPKKVLNVQVSREDFISTVQLREKLEKIERSRCLAIAYAGRMIEMKGPVDWIYAIHAAIKEGAQLRATWFGDGPLMPKMRLEIERLGLEKNVFLPGVVGRDEVRARLQETDIFLFCHKTGESPRCLTEALAAGCSLVGYGSAFPRDLVASHGGGEFADLDDWKTLSSIVVSLDRDRARAGRLIEAAAASGKGFDRDVAMQERIELIRANLT
jgi:colanic acid/amylovoran biosynthesis glycosyltransferase